jgi:UDP-N-acetylmuramate dehydrogenase
VSGASGKVATGRGVSETGTSVLPADVGLVNGPVSLAALSTFRVGGVCHEFYAPRSLAALCALLERLVAEDRHPFFLGRGANTVFPDGKYERPVISTRRLRWFSVDGCRIRAEAGVPLSGLIRTAVQYGLSGLEALVGIPAAVGGAVMMNAGGHGGSFGERVTRLGLVSARGGKPFEIRGDDVEWRYRTANLHGLVVLWTELELTRSSAANVRRATRSYLELKAKTQPLKAPSAGCIFTNPPGESAGRMIEEAGLKGLRCGAAEVSRTHANFIVNPQGRALAADVLGLIRTVQAKVTTECGIRMNTEIVLA